MTPRKAVLITGASSGFGEVTARLLAERGFLVYAGVRRAQDGERVAASIGERCVPVIIDVTDERGIAAAATRLRDMGGIYGLVNNAGIALAGPMEYLPLEELRRQFEVNVFGAIAVSQAMLPLLRRSLGRIVNVGSIAGRSAFPLMGPYCASKSALDSLTDVLRMELAPFDIAVSYIEPGSHRTAIWKRSATAADEMQGKFPAQALEQYSGPLRAMRAIAKSQELGGGDPIDVANAIAAALTARHPRARYTVGKDTRMRALMNVLPVSLRDRLIAAVMAKASA
jgi:NAD(P)-dependent dehydrogenase (short-subunit alcohol dehydrogenase family)